MKNEIALNTLLIGGGFLGMLIYDHQVNGGPFPAAAALLMILFSPILAYLMWLRRELSGLNDHRDD